MQFGQRRFLAVGLGLFFAAASGAFALGQDGIHDFQYDPLTGILSVTIDTGAASDGLVAFGGFPWAFPFRFPPGAPTDWYDLDLDGFMTLVHPGDDVLPCSFGGITIPLIQYLIPPSSFPWNHVYYRTSGFRNEDHDCFTPKARIGNQESYIAQVSNVPEPCFAFVFATIVAWIPGRRHLRRNRCRSQSADRCAKRPGLRGAQKRDGAAAQ